MLAKRLAQVKRVAEARRAAGAKWSRKPAVGRTGLRGRVGAALATPFGLATLCCLILAGWALWAGGILDGAAASAVRTSSVYAASGVDLDVATAQKIVGNRRLVVIFARPGTDLRGGCHAVRRAAAGTLVLLLSRDGRLLRPLRLRAVRRRRHQDLRQAVRRRVADARPASTSSWTGRWMR